MLPPLHAGHAASSHGGGETQSGPVFIDVRPLNVPIRDGQRVERYVQLLLSLEVADPMHADRVHQMMPKLLDRYLYDLNSPAFVRAQDRNGRLILEKVKARLLARTDQVLGKDIVSAVLVKGAYAAH